MKFTIYQTSHIGNRKYNQDRVGYACQRECLLLVLADGMGGHLHGELAAETAIATCMEAFAQHPQKVNHLEWFLDSTLSCAHKRILQFPVTGNNRPGTTCVLALVQDDTLYFAHAGDSRMYLIRENKVIFRTKDHSVVSYLLEQGKIKACDVQNHPLRNQITNCLGGSEDMFHAELGPPINLVVGDKILLASDGLWSAFEDQELVQHLEQEIDSTTLNKLSDHALHHKAGHADNISAVLLLWGAGQDSEQLTETVFETLWIP